MKKQIKIILTNSYDPDPRVYKEASFLVKKGYDVEILCWDRDSRYKNKNDKDDKKIKITRFYDDIKYGSGLKQLFPYLRFCFSVRKYLSNKNFEYLHYHDLDGGIVSLFVKKKAKRIFDMHEFYDSNKKIIHCLKLFFFKKVIKKSDGIIYCVEGQKLKYGNFFKDKKSFLIANLPDMNNFKNYKHKDSKKLRIVFTGGVRDFKSLSMLMLAGKGLNNIEVVLNGRGSELENLKKFKKEKNCYNTKITGSFDYLEIEKLHSQTDIIYSLATNNRANVQYGFGIKQQEGFALEIPILVTKNTLVGDYVESNGLGFTADDTDIIKLRELLIKIEKNRGFLDEKKENLKKVSNKYNWKISEEKLIKLYEEV